MEMVNLEQNHKSIYHEFMMGNFSVQISRKNIFARLEADKISERTINKDTKTFCGTASILYLCYDITSHACIICLFPVCENNFPFRGHTFMAFTRKDGWEGGP